MKINKRDQITLDTDFVHSKIKVYTPWGKHLKSQLKPYLNHDMNALIEAYDILEGLIKHIEKNPRLFKSLRNVFKRIKTLDGTFKRIHSEEVLTVTELFEIKSFQFLIDEIEELLKPLDLEIPCVNDIKGIHGVRKLLDPYDYGVKSFYVYDCYSKRLEKIRKDLKDYERQVKIIKNQIHEDLKANYAVKVKRNGEILVNKSNEDLIKVLKSHERLYYKSENVMSVIFDLKISGDIQKLLKRIDDLKTIEEKEVYQVRQNLTKGIADYLSDLVDNYHNIGKLDLLIGKGYFSMAFKTTKPKLLKKPGIFIKEGRHLIVEKNLVSQDKKYTPISIDLKPGVTLITGANMGGKTVSLKMIGLLCYIAQLGLFVPAESFEFYPLNFISTSIGDFQDINKGLSSFGSEIQCIKSVMDRKESFGLLLIDELARGTNPTEGFALSKSIIDYMKEKKYITVISTHFDGLVEDDIDHYQVKGLKEIKAGLGIEALEQHMDYTLISVKEIEEIPKDALNIARYLGFDEKVIANAESYLKKGSVGIGE